MTTQSESINELAKALAIAQGQMKAPPKDKKVNSGSFSYKYSDLATVIETIKEPLAKNGLAISQTMSLEGDTTALITTLMHVSGQWIKSYYPLQKYSKPQEFGGALTYARRYSLSAIVGIASDEDDDATAANKSKPDEKPNGNKTQKPSGDNEYIVKLPRDKFSINGHPISEVSPQIIKQQIADLEAWAKNNKTTLKGDMKTFVEQGSKYLSSKGA